MIDTKEAREILQSGRITAIRNAIIEIIAENDDFRARLKLAEKVVEAAKAAQCDCSPCLRESGHLIDCWFPALNQAIEDTTKVAN